MLDSIFLKPEFPIAVETRSFASFTAWSGNPTSVNWRAVRRADFDLDRARVHAADRARMTFRQHPALPFPQGRPVAPTGQS